MNEPPYTEKEKMNNDIPLTIQDANLKGMANGIVPYCMKLSEVNSDSFTKGENRDSPLWKPHRVEKHFKMRFSHFEVQWVYTKKGRLIPKTALICSFLR